LRRALLALRASAQEVLDVLNDALGGRQLGLVLGQTLAVYTLLERLYVVRYLGVFRRRLVQLSVESG
jgi:hypothetical protein